jgi:cellulose synthase/poly-beta-1,6-N-acetylglucosamine synthase-like glycosyltransferase
MLDVSALLLAAKVVFWASALAVLYVYAGYPALVWIASRAFGRTRKAYPQGLVPSVSIIIAAHNEEEVIRERIENLLQLDYPVDRLEILIASDGSTDRTAAIVQEFSAPHLRLLDFARNRGKAAVLNRRPV